MLEERQSAVEAIFKAGHIPAASVYSNLRVVSGSSSDALNAG